MPIISFSKQGDPKNQRREFFKPAVFTFKLETAMGTGPFYDLSPDLMSYKEAERYAAQLKAEIDVALAAAKEHLP